MWSLVYFSIHYYNVVSERALMPVVNVFNDKIFSRKRNTSSVKRYHKDALEEIGEVRYQFYMQTIHLYRAVLKNCFTPRFEPRLPHIYVALQWRYVASFASAGTEGVAALLKAMLLLETFCKFLHV